MKFITFLGLLLVSPLLSLAQDAVVNDTIKTLIKRKATWAFIHDACLLQRHSPLRSLTSIGWDDCVFEGIRKNGV